VVFSRELTLTFEKGCPKIEEAVVFKIEKSELLGESASLNDLLELEQDSLRDLD